VSIPEGVAMNWFTLMKRPSAFLPLAMSCAALATVLGYLAVNGVVREPDENAAAHIWQLLMAAQIPIMAFFTVKWLPQVPKQALPILALQVAAALLAAAPVFLLRL
jgi:hypothetical protein